MANTEDLRYVRTEAALRSAFMELAQEKPVAAVTASDICRRAGISRNAFYLHHAGVSELYATLVGELVDDMRIESIVSFGSRASTGRDDKFDEAILGILSRHEELLRSLLPADDGTLAKLLAEGIEGAFIEAALTFGPHGDGAEHHLRCAFSAWAMVGLVSRWISQTDRPLDEAIGLFHRLHESVVEDSARYLLEEQPTLI